MAVGLGISGGVGRGQGTSGRQRLQEGSRGPRELQEGKRRPGEARDAWGGQRRPREAKETQGPFFRLDKLRWASLVLPAAPWPAQPEDRLTAVRFIPVQE